LNAPTPPALGIRYRPFHHFRSYTFSSPSSINVNSLDLAVLSSLTRQICEKSKLKSADNCPVMLGNHQSILGISDNLFESFKVSMRKFLWYQASRLSIWTTVIGNPDNSIDVGRQRRSNCRLDLHEKYLLNEGG
jgi:hypothetical protein